MSLPEPANEPQNLSTVLLAFAASLDRARIQWGELDQLLGDRSFGFLLLVFAYRN